MNRLQRLLGVGAVALALVSGYGGGEVEYSEIKHEKAVVSKQESTMSLAAIKLIGLTGYNFKGEFGQRIGNYVIINKTYFDGDINFETNRGDIYNRFREGDLADVSYREGDCSEYKDTDGDGKKELIEKKCYYFVDAVRIKN